MHDTMKNPSMNWIHRALLIPIYITEEHLNCSCCANKSMYNVKTYRYKQIYCNVQSNKNHDSSLYTYLPEIENIPPLLLRRGNYRHVNNFLRVSEWWVSRNFLQQKKTKLVQRQRNTWLIGISILNCRPTFNQTLVTVIEKVDTGTQFWTVWPTKKLIRNSRSTTMPRPLSKELGSFHSVYHSFESHSAAQYMTDKYVRTLLPQWWWMLYSPPK